MAIAFAYSVLSVFLVSLMSLAGILALLMTGSLLRRLIFVLVSLSVGVLFGDVFIHILPELYRSDPDSPLVPLFVMGGIVLFFALEKFLRWGHGHSHGDDGAHAHKTLGPVVIMADGLHNFIDGMIITASFMAGAEVGLATLVAVILHEIPQEIGDFGILLHSGYSKSKALLYNFFSALFAFGGLVFAFLLQGRVDDFAFLAISLAAGGFIYIAGSDLVPELQKSKSVRKSLIQLVAILCGFTLMYALLAFE